MRRRRRRDAARPDGGERPLDLLAGQAGEDDPAEPRPEVVVDDARVAGDRPRSLRPGPAPDVVRQPGVEPPTDGEPAVHHAVPVLGATDAARAASRHWALVGPLASSRPPAAVGARVGACHRPSGRRTGSEPLVVRPTPSHRWPPSLAYAGPASERPTHSVCRGRADPPGAGGISRPRPTHVRGVLRQSRRRVPNFWSRTRSVGGSQRLEIGHAQGAPPDHPGLQSHLSLGRPDGRREPRPPLQRPDKSGAQRTERLDVGADPRSYPFLVRTDASAAG